jgi:MarR family 2-MHQ and catechol resistance regulon transcriptional repressor
MSTQKEITAPALWLVLARAYGSAAAYVQHTIAAQGLCISDFMVLEVLLHKGPLPISAIGEKVLLASASMTSAIDRVEKRGFVHRFGSDEDRRVRMVELTPEGRSFISALFATHAKDLEFLTAGLTQAELKSLYQGLKKIGLKAKAASPASTRHVV